MIPSLFISSGDKLCEILFWHMGVENGFFTGFLDDRSLTHFAMVRQASLNSGPGRDRSVRTILSAKSQALAVIDSVD